jgi:hypothetical protein
LPPSTTTNSGLAMPRAMRSSNTAVDTGVIFPGSAV